MKKIFLMLFLLTGCMTAPQKAFQTDPDTEIYAVTVAAVEVVPMTVHFDMLPHIENQLPTSPEEAIQQWVQNHLKTTDSAKKTLRFIVEQAEMLKTDLPSKNLFEMDEESYTLNYKIEVQVREGEVIIQKLPVEGKGFITLKKKVALATKEKGWSWLIQKMLVHLKTKMQSDLKDVFVE